MEARPGNPEFKEMPAEFDTERTPQQILDEESSAIGWQWVFDKDRIAGWKAWDAKSIDERKAEWKAKVDVLVESMRPPPKGYIPKAAGEVCVINFWGAGYYEGTFKRETKSAQGKAVYEVEFPSTKLLQAKSGVIEKTLVMKRSSGVYGEFTDVTMPAILPLPPPAATEMLYPGLSVRVRRDIASGDKKYYYFCSATIIGMKPAGALQVTVRDRYGEEFKVPGSNVWLCTSLEGAAQRPWVLPQYFHNYSIWWVEAEQPDDAVRELHIWRELAKDDTFEIVKMQKRSGRPNPVKGPDGKLVESSGADIFKGYEAPLKLLPYRVYCYSFKIGEDTYLDEKTKAKNKGAYKRFSIQLA
jgi:hypothetical protein